MSRADTKKIGTAVAHLRAAHRILRTVARAAGIDAAIDRVVEADRLLRRSLRKRGSS